MSSGRLEYLAKNTAIFAVSNFGTKLISFFLVPLYTYTLTVSEYGIADLVTTVSFVCAPILTLGLSDSVMRFALDKDSDNNKILTVGLVSLLLASVAGLLMVPLASSIESVRDYAGLMYLYCITTAISSMLQAYLRGLERLVAFAASNILCTALTAGLNILFLVVLGWGVDGYLLAYVIAMAGTSLYSAFAGGVFSRVKRLKFDKSLFIAMAKYSIVLIPNTFMWWIINSSDRVVVAAVLGTAANGILAVAYKLPSIVSVVSNTFTQAWMYSAIREENSDDRDEYASSVFNRLIVASALITACLLAYIEPITALYVASDFVSAWSYSAWLLVGNYFLTLASFLGAFYSVHKDSMGYLRSGLMGAAVNLAVMIPLVFVIGIYGSVVATFLSYLIVFLYRLRDTRKYVRIRIERRSCAATLPFLAALLAVPYIFGGYSLLASTALLLTMLVLNGGIAGGLLKPALGRLTSRFNRGKGRR